MSRLVLRRAAGFTYLAVLFAVAIMGAVLAATAVVWHTMDQRDKEQELLFIGHEFRSAIASYHQRTPGGDGQFPKKLDELLEDKRQPALVRHLRKVYVDPFTGRAEWGLIPGPGGTIAGVHSLSDRTPIKSGNFAALDTGFAGAAMVSDWKFAYVPPSAAAAK